MTTDNLAKLEAWQKSREFANAIYREILPLLPVEEKYNLSPQMRRAAVSIPANIAEGFGRYYYQSNIQFCYFARGSLEEMLSHLLIAFDQKYIDEDVFMKFKDKGNNLVYLINGYINYLKKTKLGENEPGSPKYMKDAGDGYETGTENGQEMLV